MAGGAGGRCWCKGRAVCGRRGAPTKPALRPPDSALPPAPDRRAGARARAPACGSSGGTRCAPPPPRAPRGAAPSAGRSRRCRCRRGGGTWRGVPAGDLYRANSAVRGLWTAPCGAPAGRARGCGRQLRPASWRCKAQLPPNGARASHFGPLYPASSSLASCCFQPSLSALPARWNESINHQGRAAGMRFNGRVLWARLRECECWSTSCLKAPTMQHDRPRRCPWAHFRPRGAAHQ